MTTFQTGNTKYIIGGLTIAIVAALAIAALTMPDKRTPAEKVGDAFSKLDDGVDNAARELESRTPIERVKDDVKDATDGSPQ